MEIWRGGGVEGWRVERAEGCASLRTDQRGVEMESDEEGRMDGEDRGERDGV